MPSVASFFRKNIPSSIFNRGQSYRKRIKNILFSVDGKQAIGLVQGTEMYKATIRQNDNGTFTGGCTCPYCTQYDEPCKHIAALSLELEERGWPFSQNKILDVEAVDKTSEDKPDPTLSKLQELFGKQDNETLLKNNQYKLTFLWYLGDNGTNFWQPKVAILRQKIHKTNIFNQSDLRSIERAVSSRPDYISSKDLEILEMLNRYYEYDYSSYFKQNIPYEAVKLPINIIGFFLNQAVAKNKVKIVHNLGLIPLKFADTEATIFWQGVLDETGNLRLEPQIQVEETTHNYQKDEFRIFGDGSYWVFCKFNNTIYPLTNTASQEQLGILLTTQTISNKSVPNFVQFCLQNLSKQVVLPMELQPENITGTRPKPRLYLTENEHQLLVNLKFSYHEDLEAIEKHQNNQKIYFTKTENETEKLCALDRNLKTEQSDYEFIKNLIATNNSKDFLENQPGQWQVSENGILDFFNQILPAVEQAEMVENTWQAKIEDEIDSNPTDLKSDEENPVDILPVQETDDSPLKWEIFGRENLNKHNYSASKISVSFTSGIDWLDIEGGVEFEEEFIGLEQIAKFLKKGEKYIQLKNGRKGLLPQDWLSQYAELFELADFENGKLKVRKWYLILAQSFLTQAAPAKDQKSWEKTLKTLTEFKQVIAPKPKNLQATLREYQEKGYQWLYSLYKNDLNGILADDMGLGKTLQTIALLNQIYLQEKVSQPTILVLPTSLIFNWKNELEKFAPNLKYYDYTGTRHFEEIQKNLEQKTNRFHLILTTYGTLLRDAEHLQKIAWEYAILDESQQIKNPNSLTFKATRLLQAKHRLCLTGTPVENNLMELWAQFSFLNPGMLGGKDYFQRTFLNPIQKQKDINQAKKLQKLVSPLILRRLKQNVARDLKDKVEAQVFVEMNDKQQKLYDKMKTYYRKSLLDQLDDTSIAKAQFQILESLLRLRQICCDPKLVDPKSKVESAKRNILIEKVQEVVAEDHRVLIFSQFTSMLSLIKQDLEAQNIAYLYLDGKTKNRQKVVEMFQNGQTPVFLISLKAGGVGLNLTAADYVFLYDPWWNPAVEAQAVDRTHRIGQEKEVFTYKFIVKNSVEEKILKLQEDKKNLVNQVISTEGSFVGGLTKKDIQGLLS